MQARPDVSLLLAVTAFAPVTLLALCGMILAGHPAFAVDESIYQAIAGSWLFASEATEGACVVVLSSTLVGGHHGVAGANLCSGAVLAISAATIWDLDADGKLTFRGEDGRPLIRLAEDPDGQYYQPSVAKGARLVLMAADEGSERLVHVSDMVGRWEFVRPGGKPVCSVAFSTALLSPTSGFRGLKVAPECDPGLKKLELVKWHIEGALLVLVGAENADLTLVPKADGTFVKSPKEGGKPLVLVRR